jgi:hypothetical protein
MYICIEFVSQWTLGVPGVIYIYIHTYITHTYILYILYIYILYHTYIGVSQGVLLCLAGGVYNTYIYTHTHTHTNYVI